MKTLLILIALASAAWAQLPYTLNVGDDPALAHTPLNANFVYLEAKQFSVTGAPSSTCNGSTNVGKIGVRLDGPPYFYICPGTAGWVSMTGGGTPGGSNGQVQVNNTGAFGGLALNTAGTGTSAAEVASMAAVEAKINAKTAVGSSSADAYKMGRMDVTGVNAELAPVFTTIAPITFDGQSNVITAGACQERYSGGGGKITSIHLRSYHPNTTPPVDVSGTATVSFWTSPGTGSTTYTAIGTASLTATYSMLDTTLTGWTTTVPANTTITACITGTPSSVLKMTATLGVQ
jgi:hypothetical protein